MQAECLEVEPCATKADAAILTLKTNSISSNSLSHPKWAGVAPPRCMTQSDCIGCCVAFAGPPERKH